MHEAFNGLNIRTIQIRYSVNQRQGALPMSSELIITNF
jgi:hypothetical protein